MRRRGSGLFRRCRKCAGKPWWIRKIRLELVFCQPDDQCAHNPNEIRTLTSELVFREVPGKSLQRWGRAEGLGILILVALGDPMGGRVARVADAPTGLSLLAPRLLAIRFPAGALAFANSVVWTEPPPADPARPLPGIGHARPSSPSPMVNFWRAAVGQFSRALKLRPSRLPISARVERSGSERQSRGGRCERRMRFSAIRYSFWRSRR